LFQNEFLGTVSIFHDITHQIEVDRLKSEFVATVSHELRTPMTSIKGYVEILLMGAAGLLNPQQIHFLEIVKNNNERLGVLVNDLLDLSRIEAGKVKLAIQPIDLYPLAEGALADFRQRSSEENKSMLFNITIPANLPRVMGDPERVLQIITNLLENAYDYTPVGGKIDLIASQLNGSVQVDVVDNGIGIPLSEQSRIFERFYRGEDSLVLASSGTGLGLNIVQQLVDLHHGRIWFASSGKPGEGSKFSFTIPAYQQPARIKREDILWQRS
jgi:signal transduction histidine kinase